MSSTSSKWLAGCGIGCLVLVAIFALVGYGGYTFVRGTVEGAREAMESQAILNGSFPGPEEFAPWPDGAIPEERMVRFLEVRDALTQTRSDLQKTVSELEKVNQEGSVFSKFGSLREGAGVGSRMFEFLTLRNRALLNHEMGLGEYAYIYSAAYYAWLGHDPDDQGWRAIKREDRAARGRVVVHSHGGPEESAKGNYRRLMIGMLRRQLAQAQQTAAVDESLREYLVTEIEALVLDDQRLPWQTGVPAVVIASLEPYGELLETSYSPEANPYELLDLAAAGETTTGVLLD